MAFNVTVTPQVQEVEVSATVQPYEVEIKVNDGGLKVTTNGDSGEATYDAFSGDLNIPNYSLSGLGGVPTSRTLTINGTAYDLSANRSWTVPTHDAVTIGTANGLSLAGQVLSLGLASAGVTGALSGTDWSTFNGKQNALGFTPVSESGSYANPSWITSLGWNKISSTPTTLSGYGITDAYTSGQVDTLLNAKQNNLSLTTSGSSGASTLVGSTLNIPTYTLSGLGGIGGSIASGQVAFGSGTNTIAGSNTFTFSPTSQLLLNNSVNASSAIARGANYTPTLVAAANNDVLVGLDVNPTFTNGAFTGVQNFGIRTSGALLIRGDGNTLASSLVTTDYLIASSNTSTGLNVVASNDSAVVRPVFKGARSRGTVTSPTAVVNGDDTLSILSTPFDGTSTLGTAGLFFQVDGSVSTGVLPQRISFLTSTTNASSRTEKFRISANGNVIIQNGGTFTDAGFRLDVNGTARVQGDLTISDTRNIILATGTGTKIGTATSQKLSLWNATPDVQPTTAITAAAFVANTSGIVNDTATFGGYTIGQIVAALKRLGALA